MAKKVTQDDILQMNLLYFENHNYSETARKTGFSAGTVKKYITENFTPPAPQQKWSGELREPGTFAIEKEGLSSEELLALDELRKEISI